MINNYILFLHCLLIRIEMNRILPIIEQAICKVGKITPAELRTRKTTNYVNVFRGLFCLLATDAGVHPVTTAGYLNRSRANVINQTKNYKGYLNVKDRYITMLHTMINTEIKKMQNE